MTEHLTIGILGGMGPEATNKLCALITAKTPARRDQDHIPVITYNNPCIPDRVKAIYGDGESPVPELARTARVLEDSGADMLLMPCNLAHFFIKEVQSAVRVPVLDMVEETVRFVIEHHPLCRRTGLLASSPTIRCRIYENSFHSHGITVFTPGKEDQEQKVMSAIYGDEGIKCGHKTGPRALLEDAARGLVDGGAEVVIAGCTEISLVLSQGSVSVPVIDPIEVISGVAVRLARAAK
jgi:aspartate racemase